MLPETVASITEIPTVSTQPTPAQVTMPTMTKDFFVQWLQEFESSRLALPPQQVGQPAVSDTATAWSAWEQEYSADTHSLGDDDIMDSGPDEGTSVAGDGTEEDDFLSIIDAKDRKAFEGFPFHEAVWRPVEAL
ncbi:UNVERIFIED_CONTAM: hypothetical protein FKN15_067664 [Acipenser sinensis]